MGNHFNSPTMHLNSFISFGLCVCVCCCCCCVYLAKYKLRVDRIQCKHTLVAHTQYTVYTRINSKSLLVLWLLLVSVLCACVECISHQIRTHRSWLLIQIAQNVKPTKSNSLRIDELKISWCSDRFSALSLSFCLSPQNAPSTVFWQKPEKKILLISLLVRRFGRSFLRWLPVVSGSLRKAVNNTFSLLIASVVHFQSLLSVVAINDITSILLSFFFLFFFCSLLRSATPIVVIHGDVLWSKSTNRSTEPVRIFIHSFRSEYRKMTNAPVCSDAYVKCVLCVDAIT